jgi:hypothetical protein
MPVALRETVDTACDTLLSIEITDGESTGSSFNTREAPPRDPTFYRIDP